MKTMMLTLALLSPLDTKDALFGTDFLQTKGYDVDAAKGNALAQQYPHVFLSAYRSDRARLIMDGDFYMRMPTVDAVESATGYRGMSDTLPSGLPLGSDVRFSDAPSKLWVIVASDAGRIQVHLSAPVRTTERGFIDPSGGVDWTKSGDDVFLEKYARIVVSRCNAVFLGSAANVNSVGVSVPGLRSRDGKRSLGNLHDWTKKKGWSWTEDPRGFTTLRKGTDWAVVPLGGNKVKINGQWQELPDLVSEKDGDWYLSASGLTLLNGA
jgi:hypothetical protein